MMSTATASDPMTAEEFFEWAGRPENAGRRYELEAGRAVEMPSPSELHGYVIFLIFRILVRYFDDRGAGYVLSNDTGLIVASEPDTVRGPDLMCFLEDRPIEDMSRKHCARIPALIVEVLSPSDRISRTNTRIEQYLRRGISLVWLVDPDDRTVTVYRPNEFHRVLTEDDTLTGNGELPNFSQKVASFFTK